ncbi:hypothetical protein GGS21DRAFT_488150 [Xylaria nigripes]|nr:hypothetical protein GGS21DRAFT_488150 [Xylaria nigripes]
MSTPTYCIQLPSAETLVLIILVLAIICFVLIIIVANIYCAQCFRTCGRIRRARLPRNARAPDAQAVDMLSNSTNAEDFAGRSATPLPLSDAAEEFIFPTVHVPGRRW